MKLFLLLVVFLAAILTGCSALLTSNEATPGAVGTSPLPVTPRPVLTATRQATEQTAETGPLVLVVWVPPQFDPNSGTPAGDLLKQRLQAFSERMPGVQVEVRVKAESGAGGLYDSLAAASAAAPDARPDLVALPQHLLQAAALKGLLYAYDGLTIAMSDPDWYEYARQLAYLQSSQFGMPFAGDALLLAYDPSVIEVPAAGWAATVEAKTPLLFAAADPQAVFTLNQYQAAGGAVIDDQGRPVLQEEILVQVLDFYALGSQSGALPGWLIEYQDIAQTWQAFQEGRSDQCAALASQYLTSPPGELAAAPLPTPDGRPFALASGWVWALADPHSPHQELSTRLAEFLTESSFLSDWTQAAGYLPTRPSALDAWDDTTRQAEIMPIVLAAQLYPSIDVLTNLGPRLQQATVQVLSGQADPTTAAASAVENLNAP